MKTHRLNTTDMKKITWARFLEMIGTRYVAITTDQWRAIIAKNITAKDTLHQRVTDLFAIKPIIGLTSDNMVVFRTGVDFKIEVLDRNIVWITSKWFGTYTGTHTTILAVNTTGNINKNIISTFTEFLGLTTDNLIDIPLIGFTHDVEGILTKASYIYYTVEGEKKGKVITTPLMDGGIHLTGFRLTIGNNKKTNAFEALDQDGTPFPGILVIDELKNLDVRYDAITVPETSPHN